MGHSDSTLGSLSLKQLSVENVLLIPFQTKQTKQNTNESLNCLEYTVVLAPQGTLLSTDHLPHRVLAH